MDLNGNDHIYQAVPPYLDNRERPLLATRQALEKLLVTEPDLDEAAAWVKAKETAGDGGMVWFELQAISLPETDALDRAISSLYNDYSSDKAAEHEQGKRRELLKSKVHGIHNLTIKGGPVTDFDTFYRMAPREMVQWVIGAVNSTIALSQAERKNFMPV
jgi:hypothetical protein